MNSDNDDNMLHIELSLGDVIPFELVGRDRRIRSADIALYLDQRTTDRERARERRPGKDRRLLRPVPQHGLDRPEPRRLTI